MREIFVHTKTKFYEHIIQASLDFEAAERLPRYLIVSTVISKTLTYGIIEMWM